MNKTTYNKPLAIMAAEVKAQAFVLRKKISDYPHCCLLETATIASAKPLATSERRPMSKHKC